MLQEMALKRSGLGALCLCFEFLRHLEQLRDPIREVGAWLKRRELVGKVEKRCELESIFKDLGHSQGSQDECPRVDKIGLTAGGSILMQVYDQLSIQIDVQFFLARKPASICLSSSRARSA